MPAYGPEMRGGTCNCTVVLSDAADRLPDQQVSAWPHRLELAVARQVRGHGAAGRRHRGQHLPHQSPAAAHRRARGRAVRGQRSGHRVRQRRRPPTWWRWAPTWAPAASRNWSRSRPSSPNRSRSKPALVAVNQAALSRGFAARASAGRRRGRAAEEQHGQEAHEGLRGDRRGRDPGGLPPLLRLPHHPPERDPRVSWLRGCPRWAGTFVQAESEVAASNMLYGAAGAGCRCFTSSSSPGISLMQEGHLVHRRRRAAGGHREHHAGRPGPGRHPAVPVGLLPGGQGRRPRRLPAVSCSPPPPSRRRRTSSRRPSIWPTSTATPSWSWATASSAR